VLFEWNESNREANFAKHRVDFQDAKRIFDGPVFETVDSRMGENRVVAIGSIEGIEIVVKRRIISARRAHRNERQDYANHLKDAGQGQD
jgi:uncharacterized protein